ncbi:hypothetical protein C8R46DRAFT_1213367 [Mycena filopes]|nr:hypothetical protein C8R46DRAFT_1213367 [Mycena filopes]
MTVQHFTFAKFRSGITSEEKEDAFRTVYLLLAAGLAIPGFNGFKVGPPISRKGARGYEFAITVEFQDLQAFHDYVPHAHHLLVSDFINSFSEGVCGFFSIQGHNLKPFSKEHLYRIKLTPPELRNYNPPIAQPKLQFSCTNDD